MQTQNTFFPIISLHIYPNFWKMHPWWGRLIGYGRPSSGLNPSLHASACYCSTCVSQAACGRGERALGAWRTHCRPFMLLWQSHQAPRTKTKVIFPCSFWISLHVIRRLCVCLSEIFGNQIVKPIPLCSSFGRIYLKKSPRTQDKLLKTSHGTNSLVMSEYFSILITK